MRAGKPRLGRSLAILHIDAGSCGGCEIELRALRRAVHDLERFGIGFVSTPRHADVLLVTGPVTRNLVEAVEQAHSAMPEPEIRRGGGGLRGGRRRVQGQLRRRRRRRQRPCPWTC